MVVFVTAVDCCEDENLRSELVVEIGLICQSSNIDIDLDTCMKFDWVWFRNGFSWRPALAGCHCYSISMIGGQSYYWNRSGFDHQLKYQVISFSSQITKKFKSQSNRDEHCGLHICHFFRTVLRIETVVSDDFSSSVFSPPENVILRDAHCFWH